MPFLEKSLQDLAPELFLDPDTLKTPQEAAFPEGSEAARARQARLDILMAKGVDLNAIKSRTGPLSGVVRMKEQLQRMRDLPQLLDPTKPLADRLR